MHQQHKVEAQERIPVDKALIIYGHLNKTAVSTEQ
jgi:hypothetical protein